MIHYIQSKC